MSSTANGTLYIHIGTHKTGTTSIQKALKSNSKQLREEGIAVINNLHKLIEQLSEPDEESTDIKSRLKSKFNHYLSDDIISKANKIIIINEKLSGNKRIGYKNADFVANTLHEITSEAVQNVKIIVYLRRQDDFIQSLYSQRIYNGATYQFDEYLNKFDSTAFNWYNLVQSYASVFGFENIIVRRYHKECLPELNSIINDFGKIIESQTLKAYSAPLNTNRGYSHAALETIRKASPHLNQSEFKRFKKLMRRISPKETYENYQLFDYSDKIRFLSKYEESNSRVARVYLSDRSNRLFPKPPKIMEGTNPVNKQDDDNHLIGHLIKALVEIDQKTLDLEKKVKKISRQKPISVRIFNKLSRMLRKL